MTGTATIKMLSAYEQMAPTTNFLTGMFRTPAENFYPHEYVEIDIERSEEDIAIAMTDMSNGYRMVVYDQYTNKRFIPPVLKEATTVNGFQTILRQAGNNPYQDPTYIATARNMAIKATRKIAQRFMRTIELECSQVLQTGTVSLIDDTGAVVYNIDYKPKTTHFPTAGTAWNAAGGDAIADLTALGEVIRDDGKAFPVRTIWGLDAFNAAKQQDTFQEFFNNRRIDQGTIVPMRPTDSGGNYRGTIELGNTTVEIWTYGGRYKNPNTGTITQYMDPGKVIMMDPAARLDLTYGSVPQIVPPDPRLAAFVPPRMSSQATGQDMNYNAWTDEPGENVFVGLRSRPLPIPTAIDTFGCIDSGV